MVLIPEYICNSIFSLNLTQAKWHLWTYLSMCIKVLTPRKMP